MALIKCPECGKEISNKAASCPNCGCPIVESGEAQETTEYYHGSSGGKSVSGNGGCGKAVLILLAIIGGLILIGTCSGLSSGKSDSFSNTESAAKVWAEHIVKQNLKSPSTAKFCNRLMEMKAESLGGAKWKVTGWVDSQNSFGATVRSDFVVKLELIKDGVRCIDIQIKSR